MDKWKDKKEKEIFFCKKIKSFYEQLTGIKTKRGKTKITSKGNEREDVI